MNKNKFIALTSYYTGLTRYTNIDYILTYYKDDDKTHIDLSSGKYFNVRESCEEITERINEVTSK